jgi:glycosyltransferase involved in cell wall biosynthesis
MARPTLTLVVPIYNEEPVIPELDARLRAALGELERVVDSWEVIFVDDGSKDRSLELLMQMARGEPRFKIVSFSRNFGHQLAITAGLDRADGDAVVVMDADLQDPPEVVAAMIEKWREGFDIVYGVRRERRGETVFKRVTAALFYRIFRAMLGGIELPLDAGDFRLMSRPAVLAIRALRERHRFVRGMVAWLGFKQTAVRYDRDARFAGDTKYPLRKMLRFAVDGITSFSILPLRIATWLGILSGVAAVGIGAWTLYIKFYAAGVVTGWTTIMLLTAFGFSAQLLMTGILGEYLGRIYEEVKHRPLYITAKEMNFTGAPDSVRPRSSPFHTGE